MLYALVLVSDKEGALDQYKSQFAEIEKGICITGREKQELPPEAMERLIRSAGRVPRQRTTLYGEPAEERVRASFGAEPLAEPVSLPVKEAGLVAPPRLVRPGLLAGAAAAAK